MRANGLCPQFEVAKAEPDLEDEAVFPSRFNTLVPSILAR